MSWVRPSHTREVSDPLVSGPDRPEPGGWLRRYKENVARFFGAESTTEMAGGLKTVIDTPNGSENSVPSISW